VTEESKASKVVGLAERVLPLAILVVRWKELGSDYLATVLFGIYISRAQQQK
jgi:hypothetical protein